MPDEEYDFVLMDKIKNDDRNAFAELYERYKHRLVNFFYQLGSDIKLAEDGLQEVFFRIWQYRSRYQPRARVSTYLYRIAKNYWLNEVKRLKHRTVPIQSVEKDLLGQEVLSQQSGNQELISSIKNAIDQLPEKEKMVLVLSEYQGLKYREIAEVLDIAEITVKTRMARAIKRLRRYLGNQLNLNDHS